MSPKKWIVISAVFVLAIIGSFRSGYQLGEAGVTFSPSQFKVVGQENLPTSVDYSLLGKALQVLDSNYIERPIDQQKALYGAVRGAVAAAGDDYTQFFDPQELAEFHQSLKGSFDGIGAEINRKNGLIVVVTPIEDSPA
jgi:carboxyl-terminal processing protease